MQQDCNRKLADNSNPTLIPGPQEMGNLVALTTQEWQIAMNHATIAQSNQQRQIQAAQQAAQPPPQKPDEVKEETEKDMHVVQDLVENIADKPS